MASRSNWPDAGSISTKDQPWTSVLAGAIRDPHQLCRILRLPASLAAAAESSAGGFGLLAPRTLLDRIGRGDQQDPILLQVLPQSLEMVPAPGFTTDPVGDTEAACGPGLLRKYQQRTLMVAIGACGVHCRFCFRRHFPYSGDSCGPASWDTALRSIADDDSLREVILSGGDPLTLGDGDLAELAHRLAHIPHLTRLRLHTRMPVLIPQRVTDELLAWLRSTRLAALVVVHTNHPNEIDDSVADALGRLVDAGVPVLSQTVLLRGVNDRADTLAALFERLVDLRVLPYYLHQLDPVAGAAHFEVSVATGRRLMDELRARLPGYAIPRYVRETPGGLSKQPLG